ncbi:MULTISPECIES: hypothetical protein [unclassified Duganella]|uniref:hypothetical protein n=1 Tax=unclassified Duganella TaxID=2636909 RepID=UPI0008738DAF|nr:MULTISPECIES: hypothetical protein [unclassified Duganella]
MLVQPIEFGHASAPFELLVVEVTDQGKRRPVKVARLFPVGERRAVAELLAPKLVWLRNWLFVLSGVEQMPSAHGHRAVLQSWICKLSPPAYAIGFRITNTHVGGVLRPRRVLHEAGKSGGRLAVGEQFERVLGRHSLGAQLSYYQASGSGDSTRHLLDCRLEWMAEERFELSGLRVLSAHGERPEQVECNGWLCEFDIELPELTRSQIRMLGPSH